MTRVEDIPALEKKAHDLANTYTDERFIEQWVYRGDLDADIDDAAADDVLIVLRVADMGHAEDVAAILRKIIDKRMRFIACDMPVTEYIDDYTNKVILQTMIEMLDISTTRSFFRQRTGRPGIAFPDGWADKYDEWRRGQLSSQAFMQWSGFKKATFYNKLAAYKKILSGK